MKNKKITLAFVAMIILVMAIAPIVKASDSNPLNIINEEGTNNTATNNEELNTNTSNEATNNTNNTNGTLTVDNENNIENTNVPENKLPQTGVAEDTTLFIFIAICLVSAIYAYTKIRNYKNV